MELQGIIIGEIEEFYISVILVSICLLSYKLNKFIRMIILSFNSSNYYRRNVCVIIIISHIIISENATSCENE